MSTPYGEWPSPLEPAAVAESGRDFDGIELEDETVYWLERRPAEGGRGVVVRADERGATDLTPADRDVRTLVHQYGGGDFLVADGTVWFVGLEEQRLYRHPTDPAAIDGAEPVTPEPPAEQAHRYADLALAPDGETLYAARERHVGDGTADEPVTELVRVPAAGGDPAVVTAGHDFYAAPRPSPDGERLAFLAWDHPNMPWDGTTLFVAPIGDDGGLDDPTPVAGGPDEAVCCPKWSPDGVLHAVSDRTGWWNLYRFSGPESAEPATRDWTATTLHETDAEFGVPAWVFGLSTYAFLEDGRIAAVVIDDGTARLHLLEPESGALAEVDLPYTTFRPALLRSDGRRLAFVAGQPTEPTAVVSWTPPSRDDEAPSDPVHHREELDVDLPEAYVSEPVPVTFPTGDAVGSDETVAHAIYYPPTNPDVEAPADERPPAVVTVHGGPTSRSPASLSLSTQFWTTRGVGVLDVNYRGSTGYGRAYREALNGEWGVRDTLDCVNAARYASDPDGAFADDDRLTPVDGDRLAIRGGSAGGYAVLSALAVYDAFDAGASYYGVADLESLAAATHKFESRYLDSLVGPLPEAEATYRERSPVHHAEGIDAPLLLLQGGEDEVVPPEQATAMIDALAANETPYAYVEFPDERHGFRTAENIARALEAELTFYGEILGFDPVGELEPVEIRAGE